MERIYYDIDHYRKKANTVREKIDHLAGKYNRLNRSDASHREEAMKDISANRKRSLSVLSNVLKKLISEYEAAIALGKLHPDLHVDVAVLKEQINSADVQREKIKSMY